MLLPLDAIVLLSTVVIGLVKMKKSASKYRTETDSMGDVVVPKNALYQAQTQRAHNNFQFSQRRFPAQTLNAIIDIKAHAAFINAELGLLDNTISKAILAASDLSKNLDFAEQFPLDLFQTGSGTSTNMNVNEVIATLASQSIKQNVHPNDHVNMGQSSNDVVPSAISLSAVRLLKAQLYPALTALISTLKDNEKFKVSKVDDSHLNSTEVTTSVYVTFISGGIKFWNVTCMDDAGNINTSSTRNFTVYVTTGRNGCWLWCEYPPRFC